MTFPLTTRQLDEVRQQRQTKQLARLVEVTLMIRQLEAERDALADALKDDYQQAARMVV